MCYSFVNIYRFSYCLSLVFPCLFMMSSVSYIFEVWLWKWRVVFLTQGVLCVLGQAQSFVHNSVQSLSCVWLFATPGIPARQASLSITNSCHSPRLVCIELVMPSSHLFLCRALLFLPPIPPSIRVFFNESVLRIRWPNYWNFSFSISPSNEYSGLISYRMDWFDLLAVQGTLKSLLQHHSSKASILQCSAFFIAHSHIHTWLLEKPQCLLDGPLLAKECLCF